MGRFTTSFVAIVLAFGAAPLAELRVWGMQETGGTTDAGAENQTPSDSASGTPVGASTAPAVTPLGDVSNGSPSASSSVSGNPSVSSGAMGPGGASDEKGAIELKVGSEPLEPPASGKSKNLFDTFLGNPLNMILLLFVVFYVFLLLIPKPGQKNQKALQTRLANLKKNDRVVLNSGIHGIVANINTEAGTVVVRVDESTNARLTVDRSAIRSVEA